MKKINFNFKSIVQEKARWLLTILAIFTLGVGQMWAAQIDNTNWAKFYNSCTDSWMSSSTDNNNKYTGRVYMPAESTYEVKIQTGKDASWSGYYRTDRDDAYTFTSVNNTYDGLAQRTGNDNITTKACSSGYVRVDVEFWGEYSNNSSLRLYQYDVDALSLSSLGRSSSTVASNGTITVTPNTPGGGSGSYHYEYSCSPIGYMDGSTYHAPYVFTPTEVTITVTMTDNNSQLSGLTAVQKSTTVTVNRPDNMYIKTQMYTWEYWGWLTMSSNGDGTYSAIERYKDSSTGLNWDVANRGDATGLEYIGYPGETGVSSNITLVPNDGNWNAGDYCSIKLTPTAWGDTKTATASIVRRLSISATQVTIGSGSGGSSDPTIDAASYSSSMVDYGTSVTFTAADEKDGYTWEGWFTNNTGTGSAYTTAKSFTETVTSTKTYYAIYREKTYTISVSAGEHGSITTGSPSVTAGVATNPTITATADEHYVFDGWECSAGVSVENTSATATVVSATVSATATGTVRAKFAPVWAIKGSGKMGSWSTYNGLAYNSTLSKYEGTITLDANTTYEFKVYDRGNSDNDYGVGDGNTEKNYHSYIGQTGTANFYSGDQKNIYLMSAGAGTYTFTWAWVSDHGELTVTYPGTHPSSDYVYFYDSEGWGSAHGSMRVHVYGGTNTGDNNLPYPSTISFAGVNYYYTALGNNTNGRFAASDNTAADSPYGTGNLDFSSNKGKYYDPSTSTWKTFDVTVTLNDDGGSGGDGTVTATYDAAMPTLTNKPSKDGYDFDGYFKNVGGSGTQYYNANKTSANSWDQTGASPTIYAKWTQTIELDIEGGATGSESLAATYNATLNLSSYTPPTKEGYTFAGYWTGDNGTGSMVIDANGDVQTSVTVSTVNWTDGTGKWIHPGSSTLYAKWTDNGTYVFSGGALGTSTAWSTASNWTKGVAPSAGTEDIILLKPVVTPSGTTTVNSVRIATSGTYTPIGGSAITAGGKLTVSGGTALKVDTDIQNCVISGNAPASVGSTTSSTLEIGVAGALAWGSSGSPGDATVEYHTISGGAPGSEKAVNQYFGIPFTSLNSYSYYDAWIFEVSEGEWSVIYGETLSPFIGYNIIRELASDDDSHDKTYSLSGTLVSNSTSIGSGVTAGDETLYANSWVAPINIGQIDFGSSDPQAVYMFGATDYKTAGGNTDNMGNYTAYSKGESGWIPSMQSFSVYSGKIGGATINTSISSLSYATAVYGVIEEGNNANFAPRRRGGDYSTDESIQATQDSLYVRVKSANGWGDELKVFIHEDFSTDYENGWEAPKIPGYDDAPSLYALNNRGKMAISCVPSAETNILGFHAGTASNEYTFTFKYSGEDELYLKDTKTNEETLINSENSYTFTTESSDSDMRFVIRKAPAVVTGTEEVNASSNIQKIMHNGALYIVRDGKIYSVDGAFVK